MDPVVRLLRDLVAIDSVNPALVPGGGGEGAVADRIASELRLAGLDVELTEIAPGLTLVLCGHTDTVGVEGMTTPFDPVERDGRLYGRGS